MTVWCLGSVNADSFYRVPHLPEPGETLAATSFDRGLGGKGANMAVAIARAGSRVELIGAVGLDGGWMRDRLKGYGVSVGHIVDVAEPSGHAIIAVDPAGENQILIFAGANRVLRGAEVRRALTRRAAGDMFLCQNETNQQVEAATFARSLGMRVVYAAAPFDADAVQAMLPVTDMLILNAVEAAQLEEATGLSTDELPVTDVVVTLGAEGVVWIDREAEQVAKFDAFPVEAVDTTGAGDTFTGFLLAGLDQGMHMVDAVDLAIRAAALKVTRQGTADAIPARREVEAFGTDS
ncbi:ribokinase [Oceanicola sp. 22II-s10i]|uniref:ribokinase n=1 Tax=Oceanicola sp. 22II-s10i TaxID=1317116 RepID=UPI000B51F5CD|nr:ribokinase [Oceanicola sp. 22II-s10i]OWU85992.1 ribokinase [Oceanicola sp. 22II-s10i]